MNVIYIKRLHKKEKRKWYEIREEIKELKLNADSYKWIKLLQKIVENKSKIRKNVKHAMAFTVIEEFDKTEGKPEKYFSEVYHQIFPYCYGKNAFFYGKMQSVANKKLDKFSPIIRIEPVKRKTIMQKELPLNFHVASVGR